MSNPKMKPEVKEAWINALRSGEYKQGRGTLHQRGTEDREGAPDKFCCLGVLCDLAYRDGVVERKETESYKVPRYVYGDPSLQNCGMPPQEVVDWAFEGPAGQVNDDYLGHLGTVVVDDEYLYSNVWLPYLNDYKRLSFESIARVLEMEDI